MKKISSLFLVIVASAACSKNDAPATPSASPAAESKAAPAPAPAPTPTPAAAVYSPDTAAKLIASVDKCEYDFNCDAYKPLVSFGSKVSADLAKLAVDPAKPSKGRAVAAKALQEIKNPAPGMSLFEAAKKETDFQLRGELFLAAAAGGSNEVFTALGTFYTSPEANDMITEAAKGLDAYGPKAFAWATTEIVKQPKSAVWIADVIGETAQAGDLATVQALIPKMKDQMAADRLAAKAIDLGDTKQFEVLFKGLQSEDQYERSDAANFFSNVVAKVPADLKPKAIEVLKASAAKAGGGIENQGFEKALKALGG